MELASRWVIEGCKGSGMKARSPNVSSRHLGELGRYWSTERRKPWWYIFWYQCCEVLRSMAIHCLVGEEQNFITDPMLHGKPMQYARPNMSNLRLLDIIRGLEWSEVRFCRHSRNYHTSMSVCKATQASIRNIASHLDVTSGGLNVI